MRPLQVFLPFLGGGLGGSAAARDMTRAVQAWQTEHRIWLIPGLEGPVRWTESWHGNKALLCAIPAEALNAVDVFHIGENGYAYGPPEFDRFAPDWRVAGLLDAWLNWVSEPTPTIRWQAPFAIGLDVPVFVDDQVAYQRVELDFRSGPSFPVTKGNEGAVAFRPPGQSTLPISPEAELEEYYRDCFGELRRSETNGVEIWLSDRDPGFRSLGVALWAEPPLSGFFPSGVNLDALHHWTKMYAVSRQSVSDVRGALRRATELSSAYITNGFSTRSHAWFMPTLAEAREVQTVIQRGATLGLNDARSWTQVTASADWHRKMTELVPIRRAWGPIGLFWAFILDRLESGNPLRACERCGRTLFGNQRKRFCDRQTRPDCFQDRRAEDRQRERQARG